MTHYFGQYEEPAQDFSARITRVGRAHGLTVKTRRRIVFKRMSVLAAAIAVPAMAAPSVQPAEPQVIRFVLPETIPYAPTAQGESLAPELAPDFALQPATSPLMGPGPTARPFAALVGYSDRARAQQCLAMAVYYEAASESVDGQRAVAQVVMNRVRNPAWPDSVCGVVFQGYERSTGCQFSFTCDGSLNRQPQASAMARANAIARAALGGYVHAAVGLATHYHRTDIYPYWASSLKTVTTIGLHRFYRGTGAAGQPGTFTAAYAGGETGPLRHFASATFANATIGSTTVARSGSIPDLALPATYHAAPTAAPAPVAARVAEPVAEVPAQTDLLPQSGAVLGQHARSGQWLRQP
ncbi:MAG TPA: cell wall hydrolase [Paracoccaceae bacterium]|nr:cell wall hydrolase [Paracoccaceae bacterium]